MKSTVAELVDCELHYLRIDCYQNRNPTLTGLTGWYPRGIQKLVFTYELPETPLLGGGGR